MLTHGGNYVGDLQWPDETHVVYVRSLYAHARILGIDTDEATAAPGVVAVVTSADIDHAVLPDPMGGVFPVETLRPLLARGRVRFAGESVAAVVADTLAQAVDAAEMVIVEYEPLTPVLTLDQAEAAETLLYDGLDSNQITAMPDTNPDLDFSECDVVIEGTWTNQRLAPLPIEPLVAAAVWHQGKLTQYASSQGAGDFRNTLVSAFGYDADDVRVITPDVGGGFGAKGGAHPEELLVAELARRVGRPVRWAETRSDNLRSMVHGRAVEQTVTMGGTSDGHITHWKTYWRQHAGAYPAIGAILPTLGSWMVAGVYDIANVGFSSISLATNTTSIGAYRGAGRPEAAAQIERAVDLFADAAGLDPAEVRRRNVVAPFDGTHTTAAGTTYDDGNYGGALERLLEAAGYDELRAEQARRRAEGDPVSVGIGLSCYVEITGIGGPDGSSEFGSVELQPDGSLVARTGATPFGQGHATTWAMLIADRTGVGFDQIRVITGDTDEIPSDSVTGGSRSVQIAGSSIADASDKLVEAVRDAAAAFLEASTADIVLDTERGQFHVVGTPGVSVGWADLGAANQGEPPLSGISDFRQSSSTFPFGAHCAVVEVDSETGHTTLVRHIAVDDCGTMVNPLLVEGQVHGGLAQGAAQALFEEVCFDDHGNPLTSTLTDYTIPSAAELPSFERIEMETPTHLNPLGAKGIGESGTIGATPAVLNAVLDALRPFGVDHIEMPCTPLRVWEAITAATGAPVHPRP